MLSDVVTSKTKHTKSKQHDETKKGAEKRIQHKFC